MRIQTFSIIAGSEACNARCPFCISKMTPPHGVGPKEPEVNWHNFTVACKLAKCCGCTTVMLTGKGEPTIFPEQISKYLAALEPFDFPLIELQTNGILIAEKPEFYSAHLKEWYTRGMTTIAVSIVHYLPEKNQPIYLPYKKQYIDLPELIRLLHEHGFSVRLTCILANGFIDSRKELENLIAFAKDHKVEQLTGTPVNKPDEDLSQNKEAWEWTKKHCLKKRQLRKIKKFLLKHGTKLYTLTHGAVVFDINGQNFCLNNCLSLQPDSEDLRNIIFFPDGHVRPYWQYQGAILL